MTNQTYCDGRCIFIEEQDGREAAIRFALQGVHQYRKAVLTSRKRGFDSPHHCSLPEYRRTAIMIYLEMKRFYFSVEATK